MSHFEADLFSSIFSTIDNVVLMIRYGSLVFYDPRADRISLLECVKSEYPDNPLPVFLYTDEDGSLEIPYIFFSELNRVVVIGVF